MMDRENNQLDHGFHPPLILPGCYFYIEHGPFIMLLTVTYTAAIVVGLAGNTAVAALIFTHRRLQNVTNMYIFHRTLADIMFQSAGPIWIASMVRNYPLGACRTVASMLMQVGIVTSTVFWVFFARDCYLASRPKYHTFEYRWKMHKLAAIVTWAGALVTLPTCYIYSYLLPPVHNTILTVFQVFNFNVVPVIVLWVFVSLNFPPQSAEAGKAEETGVTGQTKKYKAGQTKIYKEAVAWKTEEAGQTKKDKEVVAWKTEEAGQTKKDKETVAWKTEAGEEVEPPPRSLLLSLSLTITVCQLSDWGLRALFYAVPFYISLDTYNYIRLPVHCLFAISFAIHPIMYTYHKKDLWQSFKCCQPSRPASHSPLEAV